MGRRRSIHPTHAELEILNVLWAKGPSTVRQVHQTLAPHRPAPTALTTTLKMLQLMAQKGLVGHDDARPSRYHAIVERHRTQVGLLLDLVSRAFGGSTANLLVRAVEESDLSEKELSHLRAAIDRKRRQASKAGE